ncbi:MAG: ATPase domain-containing protein [archaeon]
MDLIKELSKVKKKEIVLILSDEKKYLETNLKILNILTNKLNEKGIYVTINRPFNSLIELLESNKIKTKNIFFIDAITMTVVGEAKEVPNCLFINSPNSLTELGIALGEAFKAMKETTDRFIFLDSLSTLLIYNQSQSVTKFAHFLTGRMREWKIKGVLISLQKNVDERLIAQVSQFCDRIIEVGK